MIERPGAKRAPQYLMHGSCAKVSFTRRARAGSLEKLTIRSASQPASQLARERVEDVNGSEKTSVVSLRAAEEERREIYRPVLKIWKAGKLIYGVCMRTKSISGKYNRHV